MSDFINPFQYPSDREPAVLCEASDPNLKPLADGTPRKLRLWLRPLGTDERILAEDREAEYLSGFYSSDPEKPPRYPIPTLADGTKVCISKSLVANCARLELMQDAPEGEPRYRFIELMGHSAAFGTAFRAIVEEASQLEEKKELARIAGDLASSPLSPVESESIPLTESGETPTPTL